LKADILEKQLRGDQQMTSNEIDLYDKLMY